MRKHQLAGLALLLLAAASAAGVAWLSEGDRARSWTVEFGRGLSLDASQEAVVKAAAAHLRTNPDMSALVAGHSGTVGDPDANQQLSRQRADLIARMLVDEGVDPARVEAVGLGGAEPLAKADDESDRAWQRRLARADVRATVDLP